MTVIKFQAGYVWFFVDKDLSRYLIKGRKTWFRELRDEVDLNLVIRAIEEVCRDGCELRWGSEKVDRERFEKIIYLYTIERLLRLAYEALRGGVRIYGYGKNMTVIRSQGINTEEAWEVGNRILKKLKELERASPR